MGKRRHNGIDDYVVPILRKQNWRVYHFHDTGKDTRVKQEHNISNNKMLLYDAANLAAFLYRLKNFFKQNYDEIVETIRLVAPYFDDFVLEPQEGNEEQIVLRCVRLAVKMFSMLLSFRMVLFALSV